MKKLLKWIGIVFVAFIVIGVIASMGEDEASSTTDDQSETEESEDTVVNSSSEEASENESEEGEETSEEVDTYQTGDEVTVGNLSFIVHGVETAEKIGSGNEFIDDLTTSGKFVIVDLTVKNNDTEARFIDSEMFRLIEDDGTEYSPSSDADMLINDGDLGFFLAEVNPKMDMRGKVAFEVHAEFTGSVQVSSGFGWSGGEYAEITYE